MIAIVGMTGSGKSELAKHYAKDGCTIVRFGDITEDMLKQQGLAVNEENEKHLREQLRKQYGMEAYAKANLEKLQKLSRDSPVVIDGLYSWEEYLLLHQHFPDLILVAVYAPPQVRYDRLVDREHRGMTVEQAKQRDYHEISKLNKAPPIAMAHYTILNVGTLHDLEMQYEKFKEWYHEEQQTKLG